MFKFSVTESSQDGVDSKTALLNPSKSSLIFIYALVNKHKVKILIDTGASKTFINNRVLHCIVPRNPILKQPHSFLLADGVGSFHILGLVSLSIEFNSFCITITAQYKQLDEVNRTWQQYHQNQLDTFKNRLQNFLLIPLDDLSFDDLLQHIAVRLEQLQNEHEILQQELQTTEKLAGNLRSQSVGSNQIVQENYARAINQLNQQIQILKQQNDQLETEKYILSQQLENRSPIHFTHQRTTSEPDSTSDPKLVKKHAFSETFYDTPIHNVTSIQSSSSLIHEQEAQELQQLRQHVTQLDQANQAWQQYQQTQFENFRHILENYFTFDAILTFDQAAQEILRQINKQKANFDEQYQRLEKQNDAITKLIN